ncbi:MAG: dual specificity protein phosphatase family protein [Candidatus Diapherotrites archaeon]|nr:dual specificity protein phosphatase family protein [Candidatus Diapherotrites archaeon]
MPAKKPKNKKIARGKQQSVWRGQKPENFRYLKGHALAGSAYIYSPHQAKWLARRGFKTVISFEPVSERTIDALKKFGIKHISMPIYDADDLAFTARDREQIAEIVDAEWRQGRKVLVHCLQGRGRTGEALNFLWDYARTHYPERETAARSSLRKTWEKIERNRKNKKI